MGIVRFGLVLALVLGWSASSSAQDSEAEAASEAPPEQPSGLDDEARALFETGRVAFGNGRYVEALGYFENAYELSDRPAILFNMGHTAQLLGRERDALAYYERYLAEMPDAQNRAAVTSRMDTLRTIIAEDEARDEGMAQRQDEMGGEGEGEVQPVEPPEPEEESAAPIGGFILLGGGLAVAAGGVVALIVAGSAANNVTDVPSGTRWVDVEGDYDASGTLGIVGGILVGVGAAAAVGGLVWVLSSGSDSESAEIAVLPGGVKLRGTF